MILNKSLFDNKNMKNEIERLQEIIDDSKNIVFFGGAGVSVESGIPDFRSSDGLYNQKNYLSPEEILSSSFFWNRTKEFYEFYKKNMLFPKAEPNQAHLYLAKLEEKGKLTAVITQNIDNLHQKAGSKNVLELHGSVYRNRCTKCGKNFDINYIASSDGIPKCDKCNGIIKPDVVLYEESLDENTISQSIKHISSCDCLIIGGTSLVVYPAAGFIRYFRGKYLVIINKSSTIYDTNASLIINDSIGKVFSLLK